MKRPLIVGACIAFCIIAFTAWFWTAGGWRVQQIAGQTVRRHLVTGRVALLRDGAWVESFENEPRAPVVPQATLSSVELTDLAWGTDGILVGRATTANDLPVEGRLAFTLRIEEPSGARVFGYSGDRSLRRTVRWPAGKSTWFVLDTGMPTPQPRQKTIVTLENID